jgi:N-methylhydantoinase B
MTKSNGLDPITVEVVRHKLEGVANEMQQTLLRSSFSPIVKEGLDASSSLSRFAARRWPRRRRFRSTSPR